MNGAGVPGECRRGGLHGEKGGTYPAALLPLPGSGGGWRWRSRPENFPQGICAISSQAREENIFNKGKTLRTFFFRKSLMAASKISS